MDIDDTVSLRTDQHHHHHDQFSATVTSPRPVIPPKPKSSSLRRESTGCNEVRIEVPTSTVGTQVNLLAKRRSRECGKEGDPLHATSLPRTTSKPESEVPGEELKSPLICQLIASSKPVIPPKPSPASILSPKTSTSLPPVASSPIFTSETTKPSSTQLKPPLRKSHAPYASIDELDDLPKSPKTLTPDTQIKGSRNPGSSGARAPHQRNSFQYPPQFPSPFSGLSPSQRIHAQRKSTSLGRNTICPTSGTKFITSPPSSTFACVSHLDLTSSSQLVQRMDLENSFVGPSSKVAPPPPPRRRNSHKPVPSPALDTSESPSLFQRHQSAPATPSTPVYAVVDKEKKWEMRRLKDEIERLNNNIITPDNMNGTEFREEMSSVDVRVDQESASPTPVAENPISHQDSLLSEPSEPLSPSESSEPISPCETNSWLVKFLTQKPQGEDVEQGQDSSAPGQIGDEHDSSLQDSPGENSSFLFSHLLNASFQSESDETFLPCENPVEVEMEQGMIEELALTPVNTDGEQEDLPSTPTPVKGEEGISRTSQLSSQGDSEFNFMNDRTENSGDPVNGGGSTNEQNGDGFEDILEQKLEPDLLLSGVTEAETSTDDVVKDSNKADSDAVLISEIVRSQEQFKSPTRKVDISNTDVEERAKKAVDGLPAEYIRTSVLPPLVSIGSFRRRSWTCSENTSTSFTESSPSSSSSSSLRERTSSISGSINSHMTWVDEGELSTGALGDAENSDACQGGSIEDFSPTNVRSPGPGSFSRRRRLVSSFFASFGKSGGGSSSSNASGCRKGTGGIRIPPPGRRKEKSRSHFFLEGAQAQKGKKAKSEIFLTRGSAVTIHLDKQFSSPAAAPSQPPHKEKGSDLNKSRPPSQALTGDGVVTKTKPSPRDSVDSESISSQAYDDILSSLGHHKERQAFYVAREILTSERTFVDVLNLLTIDFPNFLKATEDRLGHSIISAGDMEFILGGLPNLKLVNQSLLHELEERIASWKSNPKVSDIVIKTGPFLKHYSTYIRDYQKISHRFDQIQDRNSHFVRTVAEFEKLEKCRNLQLKHYMLKPVQRMPQYALLLGDYLKNLDPEENGDYKDTVRAISIVKEVAEHGNEAIRLQENAEKLVHLQNRLTQNVILKADRQLICEGELRKVCRKELQPRYFALMSDCLLCMNYAGSGTATGSKEFKLRYELPLTGMRVALSTNEDYQNEFSVISVARSFNLVAKTPKERNDWLKALNLAIKNNIKKRVGNAQDIDRELTEIGKVAPVWIADSRVTMCQSCTAEFTITFRRHHCRACGKVVCSHCSGNEAPLQYLNYEAARVCAECYTHLMEEFDQENHENSQEDVDIVRSRFKKGTPNISKRATKHKKSIPNRLEIHGNISGSAMSGYLNWKETRKGWKRQWFVLIDRVLYVYAASEDIAAIRGIPILGYQVELMSGTEGLDGDEGGKSIFQLTHSGQDPYMFQTESSSSTEKWIAAMKEATVLV